ncbi:MAG TPA: hypothetical protein VNB49_12815 [Candidatus Dormibacteraeota bacterium]|nr:hypothetical protein [Candidatus Dormibacteraeota bacterium]
MELTLNLVWVGVAIGAVLVLMASLSGSGARLRQPASYARKVTAMGCALVILFFVISMTDDLHDQQVMIEERKVSGIAARTETILNTASARPAAIGFFVFSPPPAFSLGTFALRRGIETSEFRLPATIDRETLGGRAPPVSLV